MKIQRTVLTLCLLLTASLLKGEQLERTYKLTGGELDLELDIDFAQVRVLPNDNSDEIYVRIRYNQKDCSADIQYNESKNRMRVFVDWHSLFSKGDYDDNDAVIVDLDLPSKPVIALKTKIKAGEIDFRLGGLSLKEFYLKNWAGEVDIDFDQPNRISMESMDVNCKIGEVNISNLGNAHCKAIDIDGGIGELTVDFSGEFCEETFAEIDLDIGETTLILPEEAAIKMRISDFSLFSEVDYPHDFRKQNKFLYSSNFQEQKNHLDLRISTGIGGLNFRTN